MLGWAVTFLIVALVAALLGFGGIAGVAVEAAKIVFFVAIVLFAISVVAGLVRGRAVPLCSVSVRAKKPRARILARGFFVGGTRGLLSATCQDGARRFVGAEIFGAVDVEQFGQPCARPIDTRLDRTDRASANSCCFLVRET